jgi:predicted signal transduction protein with EAL and GGDEF domain
MPIVLISESLLRRSTINDGRILRDRALCGFRRRKSGHCASMSLSTNQVLSTCSTEALARTFPNRRARCTHRPAQPARIGGEEFAILLPETGSDDAWLMLERIRAAVALLHVTIEHIQVPLTISIGIASFDDAQSDCETILSFADNALYAAKGQGRNRVVANRSFQNR